jgi:hypothetical protein
MKTRRSPSSIQTQDNMRPSQPYLKAVLLANQTNQQSIANSEDLPSSNHIPPNLYAYLSLLSLLPSFIAPPIFVSFIYMPPIVQSPSPIACTLCLPPALQSLTPCTSILGFDFDFGSDPVPHCDLTEGSQFFSLEGMMRPTHSMCITIHFPSILRLPTTALAS